MNPDELPLLDLFTRLREHGLPLGVDDYMLALRALQAGFGAGGRRALEQLCHTLWIKSDDEARLFRRLFEQLLVQPVVPREPAPPEAQQPPEKPAAELSEALSPEQPAPASPGKPAAPTTLPTLTLETDEPAQVVQAVRRGVCSDWEMGQPRFSLLTEYLPVTRRQMKQSWRHLRRPVREGPPEELDVVATVEKAGHEGILLEPVLVPRRTNRAELVLLVDQDGSMVPFHALSRQLVETARRGGRLRQAGVYYFHDYPAGYLYRDPARREAQLLPDALAAIGRWAAVLIVSDAGAARGNFDAERIRRTQEFVEQLKQVVRYHAWLNPLPHTRWPGTTAGEIARLLPMFEMGRHGLDAAISALRGRYVYWEKIYPWMM
jgi:uncharacterized protein with von Willebrand factor type A (vWA) domain